MYPKLLKKGTIIEVGDRESLRRSAVGLHLEILEDVLLNSHGSCFPRIHNVVKNPNGWSKKTASCSIELQYDKIINLSNNKQASKFLDKEW